MIEEGLGIHFGGGSELGGLGFICYLDARRRLGMTFCFCSKATDMAVAQNVRSGSSPGPTNDPDL